MKSAMPTVKISPMMREARVSFGSVKIPKPKLFKPAMPKTAKAMKYKSPSKIKITV